MSAPTNFRVEAVANGTTRLRWTNNSGTTGQIGIYRSTTSSVSGFSLLTTVVSATETYYDTELAEQTRYWYKATDDGGTTFSDVVNVTTYIIKPDAGIVNMTPLAILSNNPQDMYAELSQQIQALENKNTLSKTPCDVCLVNGAIVLDCSKGCNWFRVVMDGDINSISVIGCEECPPCDFIIPPNETYSICGWPVGCEYTWDECYDAPLLGGLGGRTAKTNGLSYGGYGSPGGGAGPDTQCCPCPTVDRIAAGDFLRIVCCEDDGDCSMECAETFQIRACGGMGPYTWSKSGNVSLSSTSGACITVTSTQSQSGNGWGSGPVNVPAYATDPQILVIEYSLQGGGATCDSSGGRFTTVRIHGPIVANFWDCNGTFLYGGLAGLACLSGSNVQTTYSPTCSGASGVVNSCGGGLVTIDGPKDGTDIEMIFTLTPQNSAGSSYSGNLSVPITPFPGQYYQFDDPGPIDIRTEQMIASGTCPFGGGGGSCTQGTTTVTVTDAAGVSATVVLA